MEDSEEIPAWAYELAGRLNLMETIVSDMALNLFLRSPDPIANLTEIRKQTVDKIKFNSTLPPNATAEGAELAFNVQAQTIAFAGRYFDRLEADLKSAYERQRKR
jgi:hypothetical protein